MMQRRGVIPTSSSSSSRLPTTTTLGGGGTKGTKPRTSSSSTHNHHPKVRATHVLACLLLLVFGCIISAMMFVVRNYERHYQMEIERRQGGGGGGGVGGISGGIIGDITSSSNGGGSSGGRSKKKDDGGGLVGQLRQFLHHNDHDGSSGGRPSSSNNNTKKKKKLQIVRAANENTSSSSSFNVQGEIRLKQELSKLYILQEHNKCIGVKYQSTWKGEDIPVWECTLEDGVTIITNLQGEGDENKKEGEGEGVEGGGGDLEDVDDDEDEEGDKKVKDDDDDGGVVQEEEKKKKLLMDNDKASEVVFPRPSDYGSIPRTIVLQPTIGIHRPNVDAVFAFAQGYPLSDFIIFIESLRDTGFKGDIVLSISTLDSLPIGLETYLRSKEHVVIYAVKWKCYMKSGVPVDTPGPERDCNIHNLYGENDGNGTGNGIIKPVDDPRFRRPLATARFELYWVWSTYYDPYSLILLIDFRDTYFQQQPFVGIERRSSTGTGTTGDGGDDAGGGVLYMFEENAQTPIGQSKFNSNWLRTAYGSQTQQDFADKPIICSGSTIGNAIAIELYLRAMVQEYDNTKCKMKGCDQGMHNYLYHSHKLLNGGRRSKQGGRGGMIIIRDVIAVPQGKGNVNNLSVLRSKPLKEWGLYDPKTEMVLNWDGTISPVVHQYDRDKELNGVMKRRKRNYEKVWRNKNNKSHRRRQ